MAACNSTSLDFANVRAQRGLSRRELEPYFWIGKTGEFFIYLGARRNGMESKRTLKNIRKGGSISYIGAGREDYVRGAEYLYVGVGVVLYYGGSP